jgi:hypothetical protein
MIEINCTSCGKVLQVDDGFAGGACRCSHCGTIQTVPKSRRAARAESPLAGTAPGQKTLVPPRAPGAGAGSGLGDLADAVAGSGLAGSGLGSSGLAGLPRGPKAPGAVWKIWSALAGVAAVSGVLWMLFRPAATEQTRVSQSQTVVHEAPRVPSFCGVPLTGASVAFVIDRGNGTRDSFGLLKEAAARSVAEMSPDQRFQVVFWGNGSGDAFYPPAPQRASAAAVESLRRAMEAVSAFGQSEVASALQILAKSPPEQVLLVTGKAWDLEESFVDQVLALRGTLTYRISTVSVSPDGNESETLRRLAERTGGTHRGLSESELAAMLR